ncbi:hypothetical protein ABI59_01420 [Acidobacteria bacterium Mor1]|nr:hypothetical protein ABI59_01420 [Acidobacteria bacterium Mor1]
MRGLAKAFPGHLGIGRKVALPGLDLDVPSGEIFGLLGPNGAGKTTTLKLLLGLLRPDAGEIEVFGLPHTAAEARARLGFLPENPYFYDYLTAEEFLDFYGRLHGLDASERGDRVQRALRRVGMEGRGKTPLRQCSKGMVQRVGLAQAIQHDPQLVILDEPMSGLDPIGRRQVRDLIQELKAEGKTVFFSSHILQDAELLCDRIAILEKGSLRFSGALRELLPSQIRGFEVTLRGANLENLPAEHLWAGEEETTLLVADAVELERLLAECRSRELLVVSIWQRRESLEDLFLRELGQEPGGES